MIQSNFKAFAKAHKAGEAQLIWEKLPGDMETAVSAYLKLKQLSPVRALLESVHPGAGHRNRYSFIALDPDQIWKASEVTTKPLENLRKFINDSGLKIPSFLPPMAASVIGYLGFDCVRHIEKTGSFQKNPLAMEDAIFFRPRITVIFDSLDDSIFVITPVRPRGETSTAAFSKATDRINTVKRALARPLHDRPTAAPGQQADFASNIGKRAYITMVKKAKDYILAGDIFQVVLSQRFSASFKSDPFAFYRVLRTLNPSPFMFYLDLDDAIITGSSPEILVRCQDRKVTIRPIAGTRPRGRNQAEDAVLAADLLGDKKELAEHLMLLDLGRNDLGRVARPGSIRVTERNIIEHYSHVMHIVSNIEGEIKDNFCALDALLAGFPAGTVSGAPKVRALQIIRELEVDSRGVYAGAVGYFSANGNMDTCIALRTAIIKDGKIHIQAGAGIVADSVPETEWMECRHKAKALITAAETIAKKN